MDQSLASCPAILGTTVASLHCHLETLAEQGDESLEEVLVAVEPLKNEFAAPLDVVDGYLQSHSGNG